MAGLGDGWLDKHTELPLGLACSDLAQQWGSAMPKGSEVENSSSMSSLLLWAERRVTLKRQLDGLPNEMQLHQIGDTLNLIWDNLNMSSLTTSKTINSYGIGKWIGLIQRCMICETVLLFGIQVLFAFIFWQTLYIVMDNSAILVSNVFASLICIRKSLVENKTIKKWWWLRVWPANGARYVHMSFRSAKTQIINCYSNEGTHNV